MIEIEEQAPSATEQRLDPRWVRYRRQVGLVGAFVWIAALAGAGAVYVLTTEGAVLPVAAAAGAVAVLLVARAWLWPSLEYRHASYRLGARALEVRRGVLWRSVIDVPRSRMQHSDVSQGPLERHHGLATLSVFTAGTRYAMIRLHGLRHERALEIREHLTRTDADDVV